MKELGEIDMVSRARATLDLVTHDNTQSASPAVYLEGHTLLSYGERADLAGESERVLRHDSKALVLYAGDRDLPTLLAYLAALRLGHAVAFMPVSDAILSAYQPEFVVPAPGSETGLADLGYRPAAEPRRRRRRWPLPTSMRLGGFPPPVPACSATLPSAR